MLQDGAGSTRALPGKIDQAIYGGGPTGRHCLLSVPDSNNCLLRYQVVVLYVEQEESVRRQLNRAQLAAKHNTRVLDAGAGDLWELRPTDIDSAKCRRRYDVFKVTL